MANLSNYEEFPLLDKSDPEVIEFFKYLSMATDATYDGGIYSSTSPDELAMLEFTRE